MGTDITLLVEQRASDGWRYVDPPLVVIASGPYAGMNRCVHCMRAGLVDDDRFLHLESGASECPDARRGTAEREPWYRWRDNTLFAVLGPVWPRIDYLDEEHYGYGQSPVSPIAPPRGIPEDASPTVREKVDGNEWGLSWASLSELLELDWSQMIFHAAWAPADRAKEWQVWLDRVRDLPPPDPASLVSTDLIPPANHVRLTWTQPLWQHVHPRFFATLLRLTRLANGRSDDVRCIFFFDS